MRTFRNELKKLGADGRRSLVQEARLSGDWPGGGYVNRHQMKHAPSLTPDEYQAWAQSVKNRPGVEVYAYIHGIHLARGLAFVDHDENTIVWFSLDENQNVSAFHPDEGTRAFLANKPEYERLKETEL